MEDDGSGRESPLLNSSTSTAAPEGGDTSPEASPRTCPGRRDDKDDDDSSMEDRSSVEGGRVPVPGGAQDILHSSIAVGDDDKMR